MIALLMCFVLLSCYASSSSHAIHFLPTGRTFALQRSLPNNREPGNAWQQMWSSTETQLKRPCTPNRIGTQHDCSQLGERFDDYSEYQTQRKLQPSSEELMLYSPKISRLYSELQFAFFTRGFIDSDVEESVVERHGTDNVEEKRKHKADILVPTAKRLIHWHKSPVEYDSMGNSQMVAEDARGTNEEFVAVDRFPKPVTKTSANRAISTSASTAAKWMSGVADNESTPPSTHSPNKHHSSSVAGGAKASASKLASMRTHSRVVRRVATTMRIARAESETRARVRQRLLGQRYVHMYGR